MYLFILLPIFFYYRDKVASLDLSFSTPGDFDVSLHQPFVAARTAARPFVLEPAGKTSCGKLYTVIKKQRINDSLYPTSLDHRAVSILMK